MGSELRWWLPVRQSPVRFGLRKANGACIDYATCDNGHSNIISQGLGGGFQCAVFDETIVDPANADQAGIWNPTQAYGTVIKHNTTGSDVTFTPRLWGSSKPSGLTWRQVVMPVNPPNCWRITFTSTYQGKLDLRHAHGHYGVYLRANFTHLIYEFGKTAITSDKTTIPNVRWAIASDGIQAFGLRYDVPVTYGFERHPPFILMSRWPELKGWGGRVTDSFVFAFGMLRDVRAAIWK